MTKINMNDEEDDDGGGEKERWINQAFLNLHFHLQGKAWW